MINRPFLTLFVQIVTTFLFASLISAGTITYEYDSLNRIVKIEKPEVFMIEYSYDVAGNRTETIIQIQGPIFDHDSDKDIDGADLRNFILGFSGDADELLDFSCLSGS